MTAYKKLGMLAGATVGAVAMWAAMQGPASAQANVVSFTAAQADRGEDAYVDNCSLCHGERLAGSAEAPGLIGTGFRASWFVGSAMPFYAFVSVAMPQQAPGTLTPEVYADIVAFIMSENRMTAGETEFPHDLAVLDTLVYGPLPQ